MTTLVITQSERLVSDDPELRISTLLGSCVACCLWDPVAAVGGMNHMLIPPRASGGHFCGVNDMELLINDLLKLGAARTRLHAKIFGGAQMVSGLSGIGRANSTFALKFLERENIVCVAQSLGGDSARQVLFHPTSGTARQRISREQPVEQIVPPRSPTDSASGLELF
ncbi:MAG: chemotaxis protein CheD [Sulfitobacter sp.]|nr:chemotaxis protein CheD [Sulfitobacter sp.]